MLGTGLCNNCWEVHSRTNMLPREITELKRAHAKLQEALIVGPDTSHIILIPLPRTPTGPTEAQAKQMWEDLAKFMDVVGIKHEHDGKHGAALLWAYMSQHSRVIKV
jgi:hypothetical protein